MWPACSLCQVMRCVIAPGRPRSWALARKCVYQMKFRAGDSKNPRSMFFGGRKDPQHTTDLDNLCPGQAPPSLPPCHLLVCSHLFHPDIQLDIPELINCMSSGVTCSQVALGAAASLTLMALLHQRNAPMTGPALYRAATRSSSEHLT